jgi:hypothetical protein
VIQRRKRVDRWIDPEREREREREREKQSNGSRRARCRLSIENDDDNDDLSEDRAGDVRAVAGVLALLLVRKADVLDHFPVVLGRSRWRRPGRG